MQRLVFCARHPPSHAAQHLSLPKLEELHTTDRILIETFETAALSLRDTLPSLRTLHITITELESMPAVSAILYHSPSSFTNLKVLSKNSWLGGPSGYLSGLPPSVTSTSGRKPLSKMSYSPTSRRRLSNQLDLNLARE